MDKKQTEVSSRKYNEHGIKIMELKYCCVRLNLSLYVTHYTCNIHAMFLLQDKDFNHAVNIN